MAAILVGVFPASIVTNIVPDVESNTTPAVMGSANIRVNSMGPDQAGYVTVQVPSSVLATIASGLCSLVVIVGAGTTSVTTTQ
jgi:hypothetical protein